MTPVQIDYTVPYGKKEYSLRVVVVDTTRELHQFIQSMAWLNKDEAMYTVNKTVHGATIYPYDAIVIAMCRQRLTWEVISHEAAHVAQSIVVDGNDEAIARITGDLVTSIGKDLKANGCKVSL